MRKRRWSSLVLSCFLLTTTVACRSLNGNGPEESIDNTSPSPGTTAAVAPEPTVTSVTLPESTDTPFPSPSAAPSPDVRDTWQLIGDEQAGLKMFVPPGWVDLSSQIDITSAITPLGLTAVLAADSERSGASLLADKETQEGSFVVGIFGYTAVNDDPVTGLTSLIADEVLGFTPLTEVTPITIGPEETPLSGAFVDIAGMPLLSNSFNFTTRIMLLAADGSDSGGFQTIFLFTAPQNQWPEMVETFTRMMQAITLFPTPSGHFIHDGANHIMGTLPLENPTLGSLNHATYDIWLLPPGKPAYASLVLHPVDEEMDLQARVIAPSGIVVAQIDNGYLNDAERVIDLPMAENGRYLVEVSEFSAKPGRYTLDITMSDVPSFTGRGELSIGQGLQNYLPPDNQHVWAFAGTAGQSVSVVLTPGHEQFDAILNLYGPDGSRLAALDEGFVGDPEVISGLELPVTGEYLVLVSSFADAGGAYTLSLNEGGETTINFHDAGDLMVGQTRLETLFPQEVHAWFFFGHAGDEVSITAVPLADELDLDVWLLDPNISRIAAQDRFPAGKPETVVSTLPQDGEYLILVRDFVGQTGEYEVSLTTRSGKAPGYAGTLAFGEPANDSLAAEETTFWLFNGRFGDVVTIHLQSADANTDLVLTLQAPDGTAVVVKDENSAGAAETISAYNLAADGQWRILIQEFFGDPSPYTLTINLAE